MKLYFLSDLVQKSTLNFKKPKSTTKSIKLTNFIGVKIYKRKIFTFIPSSIAIWEYGVFDSYKVINFPFISGVSGIFLLTRSIFKGKKIEIRNCVQIVYKSVTWLNSILQIWKWDRDLVRWIMTINAIDTEINIEDKILNEHDHFHFKNATSSHFFRFRLITYHYIEINSLKNSYILQNCFFFFKGIRKMDNFFQ